MLIALLAALVLSPPAAAKAGPVAVRSVRITAYGPMPSVTSGVLKVFRRVHVAHSDGAEQALYFVHHGAEGYPALGAQCDFMAEPQYVPLLDDLPDEPEGLVILHSSCS
ncbi:hypothetical protein [Sphingomonas sp.]|uniref:hypothetical protein n=1 Tax=Sphingomonas sp. TaxID=28214 RepID=UPI002E15A541|nr:hypothetical protein [Sphingomonas sp.]